MFAADAHLDFSPEASSDQASAPRFEDTDYARHARELNRLVNQMRDAGAQFELDLPTIVVCGNQSAGKSSLLEAICAVTLPRSDNTCTR